MKRAMLIGLMLTAVSVVAIPQPAPKILSLVPDVSLTLPEGAQLVPQGVRGLAEFAVPIAGKQWAQVKVVTETRRDADEAVNRLLEIAREYGGRRSFRDICGWPGLERLYSRPLAPPEVKGAKESEVEAEPVIVTAVTIAFAQASTLVRLEAVLQPGSAAEDASSILSLGHALKCLANPHPEQVKQAIAQLSAQLSSDAAAEHISLINRSRIIGSGHPVLEVLKRFGGVGSRALASTGPGGAEIGITASADGKTVVVSSNSGAPSFSPDYGDSFSGSSLSTPISSGDTTLTTGASGSFYLAGVNINAAGCADPVSVDRLATGASFTFAGNGAFCPATSTAPCLADQPQIAADPKNFARLGDQVYMVWRNFTKGWWNSFSACTGFITSNNPNTNAVACSANGGVTWGPATALSSGDYGRITVGGDGFVYVTTVDGSNVMLHKFSSCSGGFKLQPSFPVTVASDADVDCPIDGLDRCGASKTSSPQAAVAIDFPQSVFVAYAAKTSSTNDDIVVHHSRDGGLTWPDRTVVSDSTPAIRFMPWICGNAASASVGWYDRGAAKATDDSLTNYFFNTTTGTSNGSTMNVSVNADSEKSGVGGDPNYGDYNHIACTRDRTYLAWASDTDPPSVATPISTIGVFVQAAPSGPPMVTSVSPSHSGCGGATSLTITGANFRGVTAVQLEETANIGRAAVPVSSFTVNSSSSITASVPPFLPGGLYQVVVYAGGNNSFQSPPVALYSVLPQISGVMPNAGSPIGGAQVTIDGACFDRNSRFLFGTALASTRQCSGTTQCVVYSPAAAQSGVVDVTVQTEGASSPISNADKFTYSGPQITAVKPTKGPITGGTFLTINGTGFPAWTPNNYQNTLMMIGGKLVWAACDLTWCTVTTPDVATAGPTHVTAIVFGAPTPWTNADLFTYTPAPVLIRFETISGPSPTAIVGLDGYAPAAGTQVTLTSAAPALVGVASSTTIDSGKTTGTTPLTIYPSPTQQDVTLTANFGGTTLTSVVAVSASPALTLSIGATALGGGQSAPVTVSLNSPAPINGAQVSLTSSNAPALAVPASVTVPSGSYSTSFTVTNTYTSGATAVTLTGRYNGATASDSIVVFVPTPPSKCPTPTKVCKPHLESWNTQTCKCEILRIINP